MKNNSIPIRSDPRFVREVKEMQSQRIMRGKDKPLKPKTPSRITLAMTRHRLFPTMKKEIIEADLP